MPGGGGGEPQLNSWWRNWDSLKVRNTAEKGKKRRGCTAKHHGQRSALSVLVGRWWSWSAQVSGPTSTFPYWGKPLSFCFVLKGVQKQKKKSSQMLKTCGEPCWEGRFSNDSGIQGELLLRKPFPFGSKLTLIWWPLDFLPRLTGRSGGWLHLLAFLAWCWTPDGEKGG